MSKRDRRKLEATAYHEAGHAVVCAMLDNGLHSATINPTDAAAGITTSIMPRNIRRKLRDEEHDDPRLAQWIEHRVIVILAGTAAQRRAFPKMQWKYGHGFNGSQPVTPRTDAQNACRLIYVLHGEGELADCYYKYLQAKTKSLVDRHWGAIERVAAALLEHGKLSAEEVRRAMIDPSIFEPETVAVLAGK